MIFLLLLVLLYLHDTRTLSFHRLRHVSIRLSTTGITSSTASVFELYSLVGDKEIYDISVNEVHKDTIATSVKYKQLFQTYLLNNVIANYTIDSYNEACAFVDTYYQNSGSTCKKLVILDSGCGKGMSTIELSKKYPNIPVIGLDRSIVRLSHNVNYNSVTTSNNVLLLRCEMSDFWLLALSKSDWIIHSHYLLYPNPYPKVKHLQRRWHCHPAFPAVIQLGGTLVVRSNWKTYLDEMLLSLKATTVDTDSDSAIKVETVQVDDAFIPMTHFERKYVMASVDLYELRVDLTKRKYTL